MPSFINIAITWHKNSYLTFLTIYRSGGPRDTIPPVIIRSVPENYTTNFEGNEIRIYFDEYIKLKDIQRNLIISPPLENQPTLYPLSTSRYIRIVFNDTLRKNTTYSINFGNSIVDNNEENPFEYYKYVFSTGSYIDSLKVSGRITDAIKLLPEEFVTVMLYEVDETYTDSIPFTKKPLYITNTQKTPDVFQIENIKAGKYRLIALKDNNNNYTFQPKVDKIGFVDEFINVPADTTFLLNLFKEIPAYSLTRPSSVNSNHIMFGFEGKADSLRIEKLSSVSEDFNYHITKDSKRDTLNYWFQPSIDLDTLRFKVTNAFLIDTVEVRQRIAPLDSLRLTPVKTGVLAFDEAFEISGNLPLIAFQKDKIQIMDKDSAAVSFEASLNSYINLLSLSFEKAERQNYTITFLPKAVTEFFGTSNDTVQYKVTTRTVSDYGFMTLNLNNVASYPIIVQLVTDKGELRRELYATENRSFEFENLTPGKYYVRVVYDTNENRIWDTGNFLEGRQPEQIIYYPKLIEVRANWTLNETFTLD
jgi:uncharacterized protein (DUF2141 family)